LSVGIGSLLRPVRLGVFFDQQLHSGGGYQQAINAATLVNRLPADVVEPFFFTPFKDNIDILKSYGIDALWIPLGRMRKLGLFFRNRVFSSNTMLLLLWKKLFRYNGVEKSLVSHGIDLVYFVSPTGMAVSLEVTNYITTLWDLCHRDDLEFPEVRENRIFEAREKLYRTILPKAVAVFVDSEQGKKNAVRRYGVDDERLHVLPFSPAPAVQNHSGSESSTEERIAEKYSLSAPYVYYPAQFWSHKNHAYLLEGLRVLEDKHGVKVGAIFSGGDKGNLHHVKDVVQRLGLSDRVRFAGFVPNEEIPLLYRQSLALVMPTYFGPTNLPPLEAFALGVPVLYPDKAGLRVQVGDAALLMDLDDPSTMSRHLFDLLTKPELREEMVMRGKDRLNAFSDDERLLLLESILNDFRRRMLCWGE